MRPYFVCDRCLPRRLIDEYRIITVKLALKAHPPGGHTRAVGAIFQGARQGTPPVCPDWNSNMILTGQALKAHQGTLCI
eukprot:COSAG06_NODE_5160_length_3671_cov_98.829507_1_plen_79_part_00